MRKSKRWIAMVMSLLLCCTSFTVFADESISIVPDEIVETNENLFDENQGPFTCDDDLLDYYFISSDKESVLYFSKDKDEQFVVTCWSDYGYETFPVNLVWKTKYTEFKSYLWEGSGSLMHSTDVYGSLFEGKMRTDNKWNFTIQNAINQSIFNETLELIPKKM